MRCIFSIDQFNKSIIINIFHYGFDSIIHFTIIISIFSIPSPPGSLLAIFDHSNLISLLSTSSRYETYHPTKCQFFH